MILVPRTLVTLSLPHHVWTLKPLTVATPRSKAFVLAGFRSGDASVGGGNIFPVELTYCGVNSNSQEPPDGTQGSPNRRMQPPYHPEMPKVDCHQKRCGR